MTRSRFKTRETVQMCAALRYWGRCVEQGLTPAKHAMVAGRFDKDCLPMTLDELETLIGRLDGSWTGRGLRTWDGWKYL